MQNFIVIAFLVLMIGAAVGYIRKEKKKGIKCIGCPDATACSGNCPGCSGKCGCHSEDNQVR